MQIAIIVAIDKNNGIGYNNQLLTHISADLKRFKALTTGHTIIMGRKTFESLPNGALPNRRNIVLTHQQNYHATNAEVVTSVDMALKLCANDEKVFIIGGAAIYESFMPIATHLNLTVINDVFTPVDTFFPPIDWNIWQKYECQEIIDDAKTNFTYSFVDCEKITSR